MTRIIFFLFLCCSFNSYSQNCPDSCNYYIPNSLTPDCDGINCEILEITAECSFRRFEFTIFNRWGEVVFESNSPQNKFDSTGHKEGTYKWKLSAEFCNAKIIDHLGQVTILR